MSDTGPIDFSEEQVTGLLRAMPLGQLAPAKAADIEARREALAAIAADDLVTAMISNEAMLTAEFQGVDGFFEAWSDWLAPFDGYVIDFESVEESPGDRLLVRTRQRATPRGTDVAIESEAAALLTFTEDELTRVEFYMDPEMAERAARAQ